MFIFITIVISEPDDVTVCEGEGTVFSCVLNKNSNISSNDIHWYRFLRSTGTIEMVDPSGEDVSFLTHTGSTLTSNLTITNAIKSYTGYYWVGTSSLTVCNVSLTVVTSMCLCVFACMCVCVHGCLCVCVCVCRPTVKRGIPEFRCGIPDTLFVSQLRWILLQQYYVPNDNLYMAAHIYDNKTLMLTKSSLGVVP